MLSSFTVISVLFSFVSIYFQKAWFFNISVKKKLKEYCINDRNLLVMKTFRKEITVSNVFICEVYHDLTEQFCILIMSIIVFFFFPLFSLHSALTGIPVKHFSLLIFIFFHITCIFLVLFWKVFVTSQLNLNTFKALT